MRVKPAAISASLAIAWRVSEGDSELDAESSRERLDHGPFVNLLS
jgi:hypothetical protein